MIRFILLQNRLGKTPLPLEESEKHKVEYELHRSVVNRCPKFTNFVGLCLHSYGCLLRFSERRAKLFLFGSSFRTHKVTYRQYGGLFFSLCVDITDNELAYLECIHLLVEILDHFFSNTVFQKRRRLEISPSP